MEIKSEELMKGTDKIGQDILRTKNEIPRSNRANTKRKPSGIKKKTCFRTSQKWSNKEIQNFS